LGGVIAGTLKEAGNPSKRGGQRSSSKGGVSLGKLREKRRPEGKRKEREKKNKALQD